MGEPVDTSSSKYTGSPARVGDTFSRRNPPGSTSSPGVGLSFLWRGLATATPWTET